ncbi:MAG: hypothetical protein ACYC1M_11170 [Armatimonadota bacterium]
MKSLKLAIGSALLIGLATSAAFAADTDITATAYGLTGTTLTATVSEQCQIAVPSGVAFAVTDITKDTVSAAQSVAITDIVLASATKQLKLSIEAAAGTFTSTNGGSTWAPADISWNAATWSGDLALTGTGSAGTALSNSVYGTVATSAATSSICSSTDLVFTLKSNPLVTRSGAHTLAVTWKVESTGV